MSTPAANSPPPAPKRRQARFAAGDRVSVDFSGQPYAGKVTAVLDSYILSRHRLLYAVEFDDGEILYDIEESEMTREPPSQQASKRHVERRGKAQAQGARPASAAKAATSTSRSSAASCSARAVPRHLGVRRETELPAQLAESAEASAVWEAACAASEATPRAQVHGWTILWKARGQQEQGKGTRRKGGPQGDLYAYPPSDGDGGGSIREQALAQGGSGGKMKQLRSLSSILDLLQASSTPH